MTDLKKYKPIFIIGPTASGKTTIGIGAYKVLRKSIKNLIFYDGDELRKKLKGTFGHSNEERYRVLEKYLEIIEEDLSNSKNIIISTVLHKKEMRRIVREKFPNCLIIFLKCGLNELKNRDYKGRYKDAIDGKLECFPGITEPYEIPKYADFVIDTNNESPNNSILLLINFLERKYK